MRTSPSNGSWRLGSILTGALVAGLAGFHAGRAWRAERQNRPQGRFIIVDGVKLHVLIRGVGEPVVLLHGDGSLIADFEAAGLVEELARFRTVIVFDRPGFGYSERPRTRPWDANEQARLIAGALQQLGIERACIAAHSWGCSVALAMALDHPAKVSSLVLVSGYYFPTRRLDVWLLSTPALPVIGDVLRYTLSPLMFRALWPWLIHKLFMPMPVPHKWQGFPREMALRPAQIRASAEEIALMVPQAAQMEGRYGAVSVPTVIVAGAADAVITTKRQSARLHRLIAGSVLHVVPGVGHMVHHSATDRVLAAINEAMDLAPPV